MRVLIASSLLLCGTTTLLADDAAPPATKATPSATTPTATTDSPPPTAAKAAVETIQPAGSSDDLNDAMATRRPRHAGLLKNGPVSLIDPYFDDMNACLDKEMGLKFGLSYTTGYQRASDDTGRDTHLASDLDIYAKWRIFGAEDSPTRSIIGVYGEYRHDFGDNPVPKDLGDEIGSLWRTSNGFGKQKMAMTQAWWEQHLCDDKFVLTFGKVDPDNFYNKNRYQSDSTTFMSQAFSANPARKHPTNGLGVNALLRVAPDWYVTGGVHDSNGDKFKSGFHTLDEHDFFSAAEIGWTPKFEDMGKGAYRFTVWNIEEATVAGIPDDYGVALSCEQELCKSYVPFFRAAWSDGDATGVEWFASTGIGLEGVVCGPKDLTGIGIAWGDPVNADYREQWSAEVFHRFQLAPDVQLTLGYQYYLEPSKTADEDDDPVGVIEIRVRIEF